MEDLFESYNSYIKTFCENLKGEVEKVMNNHEDYGGKVHICAISRKMPKLLDILHDDLKEIWDSLIVITEITLPFVDWNNMKAILLADDAIYYGSTFSAVYNQIRSYSPNVRIVPLCCIKASEAVLPFDNDLLATTLERSIGHYFVNCLSIVFRKQCTPFEVEFPVFSAKLPKAGCLNIKTLIDLLKKYGLDVYEINNHINQITEQSDAKTDIVELGINLSEDNKMCKKIRFFVKDDSLLISSICAYSVYQKELVMENMFQGTVYEDPWRYIYGRIGLRYINEYFYKTLCIAMNFLYSIDTFWGLKKIILKCVSDSLSEEGDLSIELRKREIQLLFGYDISEKLLKWYDQNKAMEQETFSLGIPQGIDGISADREFFPRDFKFIDYYNIVRNRLLKRFYYTSGAVMSLFYVQNVMLDKMNRVFYMMNSDRLKYGHTFSSIISLLKRSGLQMDEKDKIEDVHKWVDAHIDSATIVPQYILVEDSRQEKFWHRVFRSGENEIYFISHWARLCVAIFNKERELVGRNVLEEEFFSCMLSWIYKKFNLWNYFYDKSILKYELNSYNIYMQMDTGIISVMDVLCNLEIIQKPSGGKVALNDEMLDTELGTDSILPQNVMDDILDYMENLHKVMPNIDDYRYFVPFFNAKLGGAGITVANTEIDPLQHLFDFMESAVDCKMEKREMVRNFSSVKKQCYMTCLSEFTSRETWYSPCKKLKDEELYHEIENLLSADNMKSRGYMVLLKIIELTVWETDKEQLLDFLKVQKNSSSSDLMGMASSSNIHVYKKILQQGKKAWSFL